MKTILASTVATLLIASFASAQGADNCGSAQAITGMGPFNFDNNGATNDGPTTCTTINSDVWFAWTAPSTGIFILETCGLSSLDTKLGVWDGLACPPTVSLDCNDDSCSLQSRVSFSAVAGQQILVQLGSFSSSTQGTGQFQIFLDPCSSLGDDALEENDDCSAATSLGSGVETGLAVFLADEDWYSMTVDAGATLDVTAYFSHASADVDIALFDSCGGLGLSSGTSVSDDEVVSWTNATGVAVTVVLNVYVWAGSSGGCTNYDLDVMGASGGGGLGTNYCLANPNSTGSAAIMEAVGSLSVVDNNLVISAEPVPNQPGLFFHADTQTQVPFGEGFLCAAGTIVRFAPAVAVANRAERTVDLPATGITTAGTVNFQYWYRDPAGGGTFFNTSDGLELIFLP